MVDKLQPKTLFPIHTFHPEKFERFGVPVQKLEDGKAYDLSVDDHRAVPVHGNVAVVLVNAFVVLCLRDAAGYQKYGCQKNTKDHSPSAIELYSFIQLV